MNIKGPIIIGLISVFAISCAQNKKDKKPYVIEVTTFSYKEAVMADEFWPKDADVESNYTSKQPGYISRESGYSEYNNEVVVVVRWKSKADADASMKKFINDTSVKEYANMIDASTMKMARYEVK